MTKKNDQPGFTDLSARILRMRFELILVSVAFFLSVRFKLNLLGFLTPGGTSLNETPAYPIVLSAVFLIWVYLFFSIIVRFLTERSDMMSDRRFFEESRAQIFDYQDKLDMIKDEYINNINITKGVIADLDRFDIAHPIKNLSELVKEPPLSDKNVSINKDKISTQIASYLPPNTTSEIELADERAVEAIYQFYRMNITDQLEDLRIKAIGKAEDINSDIDKLNKAITDLSGTFNDLNTRRDMLIKAIEAHRTEISKESRGIIRVTKFVSWDRVFLGIILPTLFSIVVMTSAICDWLFGQVESFLNIIYKALA